MPLQWATTTSLTVSPSSITYGSETGVTLSGTVTGVSGDGNPTTGSVTISAGSTTLCTDSTLTVSGAFSATYSCTISSSTLLNASGTAYSAHCHLQRRGFVEQQFHLHHFDVDRSEPDGEPRSGGDFDLAHRFSDKHQLRQRDRGYPEWHRHWA